MICRHKLYHFTVAIICFTAPLARHGKTKFATVKWYNLCRQIIQSQMCYPLNLITQYYLLTKLLTACKFLKELLKLQLHWMSLGLVSGVWSTKGQCDFCFILKFTIKPSRFMHYSTHNQNTCTWKGVSVFVFLGLCYYQGQLCFTNTYCITSFCTCWY